MMDDREICEIAMLGYQSQLNRIDQAIAGIRSRLGIRGPRQAAASTDGAQTTPKKKRMSAAARKRIGEATRLRWIAFRKQKAEAERPAAKPKRKLSKAGRAAIIAATKKRWAAVHKAQMVATKKTAPKATAKKAPKRTRKAVVKTLAAPVAVAPAPATA